MASSVTSFSNGRGLLAGSASFCNGVSVVHARAELRMPIEDAAVSFLDGRRETSAVGAAEVKARLRGDVCVTPSIENDPGNVAARVETAWREDVVHVRANLAFVVGEVLAEQTISAERLLIAETFPWRVEGQANWRWHPPRKRASFFTLNAE